MSRRGIYVECSDCDGRGCQACSEVGGQVVAHAASHRSDDRGPIADKDCRACERLFFIFGSQVVDEPIDAFEKRIGDSEARALKIRLKATSVHSDKSDTQ